MARIIYVEHSGKRHVVEASAGTSVMRGAVENGIPGIDAICGGSCSCSTCHGYIEVGWLAKLASPTADELALLEAVPDRRPNSRLTCQIIVSDRLDGLSVTLPEHQLS